MPQCSPHGSQPFWEGSEPPEPAGRPSRLPQLQGHLHNVDLELLLRSGHRKLIKIFGFRLNKGHKTALLGAAHAERAKHHELLHRTLGWVIRGLNLA